MKHDEIQSNGNDPKRPPTNHSSASLHQDAVGLPPAKKTKKPIANNKFGFLVAVFVVALVGGSVGTCFTNNLKDSGNTPFITSSEDGNKTTLASEEAIAQVAREVSPSVVSILTSTTSNNGFQAGQAAGTGIIVSKDGYIMTNKHVISDAASVTVSTSKGDIYENVKVIGKDALNDVAFLKIEGVNDLTPAKIGQSDTLQKGQTVVAIGNSLGQYQDTVTSGIVSGLGRPVSAQSDGGDVESLTDLIQTDAAINPGNSGGPLVNLKGQVVGINTAVASDANGIGFAIPIDATKGLLRSVLETGKAERAYIGVRYVDITPALAKARDLPVKQGALVTASGGSNGSAVVKGGPADKAGIKENDILTKVNGAVVGKNGNVSSLVSAYMPNETIDITYLRNGKETTTKLTLATYKETEAATMSEDSQQRRSSDSQSSPFDIFQFGF